jgi:protein-S-isoprenylcysteine O-methyltransferase Ste14
MEGNIEHLRAVPAPLIFLLFLLLGALLDRVIPVHLHPNDAGYVIGVGFAVVAILIGTSALMAMRQAHTSPVPSRPAAALVESGVFGHSRNPMYLSMFLMYLGISFFVNVIWLLLLFPAVFFLVDYAVVRREERYLDGRFGDEYKRFKARVPRWI